MPTPPPIVDFSKFSVENVLFDREEIQQIIPHRHEMLQLDRIVAFNPDEHYSVGIREIGDDEFWVRGHIPGRPLFPGVLMIEASGQLCTFHIRKALDPDPELFLGMAKLSEIRFRGTAGPGDYLVLMVKMLKWKRRLMLFKAQAFLEGSLIFEGEITGTVV